MSVIHVCEACGEETVVERVLPGAPLKCIHCDFEKPGGGNGHSTWLSVALNDSNAKDPANDV